VYQLVTVFFVICAFRSHSCSLSHRRTAQASQNRGCPKPACGATKHISQQSSEANAAAAVADSDAADVVTAGAWLVSSSLLQLLLLLSTRGCVGTLYMSADRMRQHRQTHWTMNEVLDVHFTSLRLF